MSTAKQSAASPNFLALPSVSEGEAQDDWLCTLCCPGDVDEIVTVEDVVTDGAPDAAASDPVSKIRSMSKRALLLEAVSPRHLMSHYPHNPFCEM